MRHEYYYDHVRIENMLLEEPPQPRDGALTPDLLGAGTRTQALTLSATASIYESQNTRNSWP